MWKDDEYIYTNNVLEGIAKSYKHIYSCIEIETKEIVVKTEKKVAVIYNPWSIAEYKADFDMALNSIGKGRWTGDIEGKEFRDYKRFGRLQVIVVADIYGGDDYELEGIGFFDIPRLRGYAYYLMAIALNS